MATIFDNMDKDRVSKMVLENYAGKQTLTEKVVTQLDLIAGGLEKGVNVSGQVIELIKALEQDKEYKHLLARTKKSTNPTRLMLKKSLNRFYRVYTDEQLINYGDNLLCLFEHVCKILDLIDYVRANKNAIRQLGAQCSKDQLLAYKEQLDKDLPPDISCREQAIIVFSSAMAEGYLERLNTGTYKCTNKINKTLLAYLCGRLFCNDYPDIIWVDGDGGYMPKEYLKAIFGYDVAHLRMRYITDERAMPKKHYLIDKIFDLYNDDLNDI